MSPLLRIIFAVIVGVLVTTGLEWLAPAVPRGIDILLGVIAAFIVWHYTPRGASGL